LDVSREASLTLEYSQDGRGFAGLDVAIYRVASVDAACNYALCGDFADVPVSLTGIRSQYQWRQITSTLVNYAVADAIAPTITGTTEDGGYTATATVNVGDYDKALKITDLYLKNNEIRIVVNNESNMNITRFFYTISCYDYLDNPIVCHENGGSSFEGSYRYTLYEGDSTTHGLFHFGDFVQPQTTIARVTMQITGYSTDQGLFRDIREDKQIVYEFKSSEFIGAPTPAPDDTIEIEPPVIQIQ
jgi:hypothetical protein